MKEAGYDHWNSPNTGATNSSGWSGLPGGSCYSLGFFHEGDNGFWWSASESGWSGSDAWDLGLYSSVDYLHRIQQGMNNGMSARCVRD